MTDLTNAPGYASQIGHLDDTKQPSTIAATAILIVVSTLAVAGRIVAHRMVQPKLLADDYCAIAAWIISLGLCATLIACVKFGLGLHVVAVELQDADPPQDLVNVFKTGYSMTIIAIPDLFFIKLSLLLFYRRIFTTPQPKFRIGLQVLVVNVTAWTIAALVVFIYQCSPIPFFWLRAYSLAGLKPPITGWCLPSASHQAAPAILNSLSDLLILLLPAIALWPLQMRRSKKIGLFLLFSLGAFVCGTSIVKIVFAFAVNNDSDSTYLNTELLLWTVVECCIGLVCACLPCMVPLARLFTRGKAAFRSRSKAGHSGVVLQNVNSPRFPGGRRLHSSEAFETAATATMATVAGTVKGGQVTTRTADKEEDFVSIGGEVIPWDRQGRLQNKVKNEAIGGFEGGPGSDVPEDAIKVESGMELKSERGEL